MPRDPFAILKRGQFGGQSGAPQSGFDRFYDLMDAANYAVKLSSSDGLISTEMSRHSSELCVEQRMKIFTGGLLRGLESSGLYYPRQELAMFVFGDPTQTLYPSKARQDQTAVTTQLGMFSNCGRSSGFAHLRRRLVNISSTGTMPFGVIQAAERDEDIPRKLSRLLVNTLAPHCGQKFRSRPLPDRAM
jgi:hypothetical protein